MLKDGQRFCDVCEENIPKGSKYQRNRPLAHAAHLVAAPVTSSVSSTNFCCWRRAALRPRQPRQMGGLGHSVA